MTDRREDNSARPCDPADLTRFNKEVIEEIKRHKWIESEKAGRDIGDKAAFEWLERHYEEWLRWRLDREKTSH